MSLMARLTRLLGTSAWTFVWASIFALSTATVLPAQTQATTQYYDPGDGSHRINMSGRLRMLSQRIVGMACNQADGIEPVKSSENLQIAVAEFSTILNALENGNPDLRIIGPEQRGRTLIRITQLGEIWNQFGGVAGSISDAQGASDAIAVLARDSGPLLAGAIILVNDIVEQYFNPVVTIQAEAMTIDFAGRQRMFAQRMSKNVCLINMGLNEEVAIAELSKAYELFDATLGALQTGMPSVGVSAPPNQGVVDGLQVVVAAWDEMSPLLVRAMNGERFDDTTRAVVFNGMNDLTQKMNTVVGLYADASLLGGS